MIDSNWVLYRKGPTLAKGYVWLEQQIKNMYTHYLRKGPTLRNIKINRVWPEQQKDMYTPFYFVANQK